MAIEIISKIRRFVASKAGQSPIIARSTGLESLAMAQVDAPASDMGRAGRRYMIAYTGVPTGQAPVIAQPVTGAAQWVIWNADSQKSYVFDTIGAVKQVGVVNAAAGIFIQCCLFTTPAQTGANTANLVVVSASNGGLASKAIVKSAVTITTPLTGAGPAAAWYTIAKSDGVNVGVTNQPSIVVANRDIRGRIIVPPLQGLGINVYTTVGSLTFFPYASWTEVELDLE